MSERRVVLETADGRRRHVTLGSQAGPPGSQGAVWWVRELPRLAVKLVRRPEAHDFPEKLEAMLRHRPERMVARNGIVRVAWAVGRVRSVPGDGLIGYAQPALTPPAYVPLHKALSGTRPQGATWRWYVELAADLARTVAEVHRAGHVVVDVSPENLFVTTAATAAFVDVDGWQIRDARGGTSLCSPFSRPEYTPPEHLADPASGEPRAPSADRWALAVVLTEILTLGVHPFAGIPPDGVAPFDVRANVEARASALLGSPLRLPAHAAAPSLLLTGGLRELATRCFGRGHGDPDARPAPEEWEAGLSAVQYGVRSCAVRPAHVHPGDVAACAWCEVAGRTGNDPFGGGR